MLLKMSSGAVLRLGGCVACCKISLLALCKFWCAIRAGRAMLKLHQHHFTQNNRETTAVAYDCGKPAQVPQHSRDSSSEALAFCVPPSCRPQSLAFSPRRQPAWAPSRERREGRTIRECSSPPRAPARGWARSPWSRERGPRPWSRNGSIQRRCRNPCPVKAAPVYPALCISTFTSRASHFHEHMGAQCTHQRGHDSQD